MDNDEQRDPQEELANSMIPFEENGYRVFEADRWDVKSILWWMILNDEWIILEELNGDLVLGANLKMAPDGSLWRFDNE